MKLIWDRIGQQEWERATAGTDLPMQQHWTYGAVLTAMGRRVRRAEICREGRRVGLAQLVARRLGPVRLSLLGRGPVWLDGVALEGEADAAALRLLARGNGICIATPGLPVSARGLIPLVTSRHEAVLDLRHDLAAIRSALSGKWRNRLVRAEAAGLDIVMGAASPERLDEVLACDALQQRRSGYRALPPRFTRLWAEANPGGLRLYEARRDGHPVAWMLMLLHRPTASYHIGWTGQAGRKTNAHQLILWHAIRDLKADGYRALDLGDVNTEDAPGLARFKTGCGARVAPLGATMLVLPSFTRPRP